MIKLENITLKETLEIAGGDEQLLRELFDKFRQWLQQQIHLPQSLHFEIQALLDQLLTCHTLECTKQISDNQLQSLILTSKFDLKKAKKRLDSLCTLRTLLPEFFANYDPLCDDIARFLKSMQCVKLPKLSPEKHRIYIFRCTTTDSSLLHMPDYIKYIKVTQANSYHIDTLETLRYMCMEMDLRMKEDQVNSNLVICDCSNFTFGHMIKYTPSLIKKFFLCLEAYGVRIKAIYLINAPTYINQLLALAKMIMKPKLYERIHISPGIEFLSDDVPKSILPKDYGGEEPSLETLTDMWHMELIERRDWLLEHEKLKTNESLRTEGAINADDLFGVAGTFRKLDID